VITDQAKNGIHRIVLNAVQSRLTLEPEDTCHVEQTDMADGGGIDDRDEKGERDLVILTISSLLFRLLVIFQIDDGQETRRYFAREESDSAYQESFAEVANLCCGAVNRELLRFFPDLGMSTPYRLKSRGLALLKEWAPGLLTHFAATINGSVRIGVTVCMIGYAPIDFVFEEDESGATETGELELF